MFKHPVSSVRSNDAQRRTFGIGNFVEVREAHGAGVESGNLIVVQIRCNECLRGKASGDAAHVRARNPQVVQSKEIGISVIANGGHDQRFTTQQLKIVGNVSRTPSELTAHFRYQECDIQNVDLLRQNMVLETIMKNHDVVVRDGAADERGHRVIEML